MVSWPSSTEGMGAARLAVQGENRPGLLEEVSSQIAAHGGNIMRHYGATREGAFSFLLTVELADKASMDRMLASVRSVDGVFDAFRADELHAQ